MGKRPSHYDPPSSTTNGSARPTLADDVRSGTVLTDVTGKRWRLGESIGTGGFGQIYLASDRVGGAVRFDNSSYVAKIERHTSGPLFVEMHCYLNVATKDKIDEWIDKKKMQHLGVPYLVSSGSHLINDSRYRFLILPRYRKDLQHIFKSKNYWFNAKTVITVARQTLDALEYIHGHGYVHSDIKASNILLCNSDADVHPVLQVRACRLKKLTQKRTLRSTRRLYRPPVSLIDKVYLVDYGLASKFVLSAGQHKRFCPDLRKAHMGTTLFCSRDAHAGAQSRRSDLECLGYNMIYWLTSNLPWSTDLDDNECVYSRKKKCFDNLHEFLDFCFGYRSYPPFIYEYFRYIQKLEFEDKPDYTYLRSLLCGALSEHGFANDLLLELDNPSCRLDAAAIKWRDCENGRAKRTLALDKLQRTPLKSNLPMLRKQLKKLKLNMNWSKILIDPNLIMKNAARERTLAAEAHDSPVMSLSRLDLRRMNPTPAMHDVFNRFLEKQNFGKDSGIDHEYRAPPVVRGYTAAMIDVYKKMRQQRVLPFTTKISVNLGVRLDEDVISGRAKRRRGCKTSPAKKMPAVASQSRPKRHYSLRG